MKPEVVMVISLMILSIFLIAIVVGALIYERTSKKKKLEKIKEGEWLFSNFHDVVFDAIYKNSKAEKLCGIDRLEYERMCKIVHKAPEFKKIVAYRIEGAVICFLFLLMAYVMSYSVTAMIICLIAGIGSMYFLWMMPYSRLKSQVENKLFYVSDDLPRFLSLLEKAMDLPIDQAMLVTASKFDSPLSEDLIDSINKVALGANGWQETLLDLARTYEIENFSDLVLEIINSYEQGVNIRPLITRKAYEVEQSRMYAVESHDARIKTMIYLPIIGLKVLPLMALICLPMLGDIL